VFSEKGEHSSDTEVRLMVIRKDEETRIEPHAFTKGEFDIHLPIVSQILKFGMRLEF